MYVSVTSRGKQISLRQASASALATHATYVVVEAPIFHDFKSVFTVLARLQHAAAVEGTSIQTSVARHFGRRAKREIYILLPLFSPSETIMYAASCET